MFKKLRRLLIDEKDVVMTIRVLNAYDFYKFSIGRCGWAKAPDAWFVLIWARDGKYYKVLKSLKNSGVELLPETVGY